MSDSELCSNVCRRTSARCPLMARHWRQSAWTGCCRDWVFPKTSPRLFASPSTASWRLRCHSDRTCLGSKTLFLYAEVLKLRRNKIDECPKNTFENSGLNWCGERCGVCVFMPPAIFVGDVVFGTIFLLFCFRIFVYTSYECFVRWSSSVYGICAVCNTITSGHL